MKKHYRKETDCLNCGAELKGKFCYACGQENLQIKESFGHMMNHAISDYFHFDHQFFNTLKPLLFQPGKLTNEYMAGRRVQYLHPVKMYIFISLVYFVLLFQSGFESAKVTHKDVGKKDFVVANKIFDSLSKDSNNTAIAKSIFAAAKQKTDTVIKKTDTADDDDVTTVQTHKRNYFHIFRNGDDRDTTYEQYLGSQEKLPADKQDNFFRKYLRKREFELGSNEKGAKAALAEGIKHYIPKMMFLLLPLFALLLKIVFRRNKKFYVEHLIYSFHFHCFLFLFLAVIMLSLMAIPVTWHTARDIVYWIATLGIIWYIYKSLRVVYNRSRGRTISKMVGLTFSYFFVFSFCMLFLVIIVALFD